MSVWEELLGLFRERAGVFPGLFVLLGVLQGGGQVVDGDERGLWASFAAAARALDELSAEVEGFVFAFLGLDGGDEHAEGDERAACRGSKEALLACERVTEDGFCLGESALGLNRGGEGDAGVDDGKVVV